MKKYITILFLLYAGIFLPITGCSDSPKENKNTTATKKTYPSEDIKMVTNSGDNKQPIETAIERTNKENKYLFLVFYKQNDQKSKEMKQVVAQSEKELSEKANFIHIDMADQNAQSAIKKYGIDKAPIPITLVMAPNGAIVNGFPEKVDNNQLSNAFVSQKTTEVVKAVQDGKLVYLYIANRGMQYYKKNLNILQETAKVELKGFASVIEVDPTNKGEASLLSQCKVVTPVTQPSLLIISGGRIVGQLAGEFAKELLLARTASGCGGGGGSCCPK